VGRSSGYGLWGRSPSRSNAIHRIEEGHVGKGIGEDVIEALWRGDPVAPSLAAANAIPAAITRWAIELADSIALDQTAQHVAIFVPEPARDGLRLAAQIWGAGEDLGDVIVGEWVVPLDGSVTGRVFRTGAAALCADITLDPDYRSFPGGRTRSFLTVPVGSPDEVVGVINIESPWASAFSVRDYENVTARARRAAASFPGPIA